MQPQDQLMTAEQVSAYLQIGVTTLYTWRYLGTGPACAKIGRYLRYRRADIDAWVAERVKLASQHGWGR